VFLLYVVAYIDRVNVSFAALRMNADLALATAYLVWVWDLLCQLSVVRDTRIHHGRALERKEMDRANHDLLGTSHDPDRLLRTSGQFYAVRFF